MKLIPLEKNWQTINELLEDRAAAFSGKVIYNFLSGENTVSDSLGYGELYARAQLIASHLQRNFNRGDRILLLFPQDHNYIAAFFGCLYAGMIAVPAYPPRNNRHFGRIEAIVHDAQAAGALLTTTIENRLRRMMPDSALLQSLKLVNTELLTEADGICQPVSPTEDVIAFLQYTSGSTSNPKGVIVTHGNLIQNQEMIRRLFRQTNESVILGWLPLYHDMGLIGNVLQPLYVNAECYLMKPAEFIQNPLSWLKAVSTHRATTSGGPNFAYELCLKRVKENEIATLDLSCWTVAFNGAEPVRAATLENFASIFEAARFDKKAFVPCYGLAEATLLVSGGAAEPFKTFDAVALEQNRVLKADGDRAKAIVNCGAPADAVELEIVNPETAARARKGEIGEIWITAPSVAQGYWNRAEESEKTFAARLASGEETRYLRTGDLGFLDDGNLFVTGRIKDLIILNGRNLYPQDIEKSIEQSHRALRREAGIAFAGETENGERLVVVHELEPRANYEANEIFGNIQKVLAAEFEIAAAEIILIRAGTLPKTSSGKKQRRACRADFLNDRLEIIEKYSANQVFGGKSSSDESASSDEAADFNGFKSRLRELAARVLKIDPARLNDETSLLEFGLDSLAALELTHAVGDFFKVDLPVADLLEAADFEAVCRRIHELTEKSAYKIEKTGGTLETPLSAGQKSLWFLQQIAPENTAYNLNFLAFVRNADFDAALFKRAFEKISLAHDSLRSTFFMKEGEPRRKIHEQPRVEWLEQTFEDNAWEEVKKLIEHEFQKPFELVEGPLLRVGLWKIGNGETLFSMSAHHLVADFWSLALIVKHLGNFYGAGEDHEIAGEYAQFVADEKIFLDSEDGKKAAAFWRGQLSGELPVLELPFDFPRPAMQTFNGETAHFRIDSATVEKLKNLSRDSRTTLFTTLLAAYKVLLYRYTNQTDIIVGTPTAGRENPAYRNLVGFLVNPVAVRSFPEARLSFIEYLAKVKNMFLDILKNRSFPFLQVVENAAKTIDPSRPPIFQTMFILQQSPQRELSDLTKWAQGEAGGKLELGNLTLESVETPQKYSQFDLSLMIAAGRDGELSAAIQYNSDLFKPQTIERIGRNFGKLLAAIAENARQSIAELDLLDEREYEQAVFGWNATERVYQSDALIHELFEKQAAASPQNIAVSTGKKQLTYRELNEQANALAAYLRKRGVVTEDCVGVCLDRTEKLIVVLLGILKAGAAYIPLDPAYPKNRLDLMLADSGAKFVVIESRRRGFAPSFSEIIELDAVADELQKAANENSAIVVNARSLAYIIYTSGSTGQPKGVAIEHRNVCALIDWAKTVYSSEDTKKVLASTSICFDLSVFEIFFTLSRGGQIHLVENALELISAENLSDVTLINTVPSAMIELCRHEKIPAATRIINLAGEPLLSHLVEKVYANRQIERLYNLYGPSEDTTYSTFALIGKNETRNPVVGKPISNTTVYLLNERGQPVPLGAVGEIYLGGDGVTRGYFNQPHRTAEKFVPDHLSGKSGARLYKTADLARFSENGDLIFLGRSDHQVKIRGFRIELGEIETLLGRHPAVKENIVTAHVSENTSEKSIAAYVVPNDGAASKSALQAYLGEHLPAYMIPANFVFLEALPLTPNGKIDRKSLPAPVEAETPAADFLPRTPVEEIVANELAGILGGKNIGIYANFFEHGGHSLSATRAAYRLRQVFQVEIPLRVIFERPTAAALAAYIEQEVEGGKKTSLPRIEKITEKRPLRLSSAQRKLWFIEKLRPLSAAYNVAAALRLNGNLDVEAMSKAFEDIINRHDSFRTRFVEIDGEPFQVIDDATRFELEVENRLDSEDPLAEANAEARRGFDLSAGGLLRLRLWRTKPDEYILLLVMHHIITDGWSLGVLVKEIKREYERQLAGAPASAEKEALQYGDYAEWQAKRIENGDLSGQIEFWKKKLEGITGKIELPADYERPAEPTFKGAKIPLRIAGATVARLRQIERGEGITLFMLLVSALNILLRRYTGETDICVGIPVASRLHRETEHIIGFFVNSLVIRTKFDKDETVHSLIRKTASNAVEAYSNQELPFDVLVENLPLAREISRNPVFQVAFSLQNAPAERLSLPGIECEYIEIDTETSKFDLTFDLRETENGLEGSLEYAVDIFSAATADELAKHFAAIAELMAENLSLSVAGFPVLSQLEIEELKQLPNAAPSDYPADLSLGEIFTATAEKFRSATALVWEGGEMTYGELDEKSNALANYLRRAEIAVGDCVAVAISRAPEAIISMLGALKAGIVYVPLDPSFPAERINYILCDTGAKMLLTLDSELENYEKPAAAKIVRTAAILSDESLSKRPSGISVRAENAAYVMYTSGSTGQPKGVCVTHRNIARLVKNQNYVNLDESEVILQLAPLSFDASTFEIWGALLNGGRLALMPGGFSSAQTIAGAIAKFQITTLWLTAGLFHLMIDEEFSALANLKQLLAGGDVLSTAHVNKFLEKAGGKCTLVNGYGPTENTTFTACFPITKPVDGRSVPIGKSISNTRIYIVDENLEIVPRGVVGELVAGGDGVSNGYLNKPRLTAKSFVPNPFDGKNGSRLYRTGDLARLLPDGAIEFVGRKDEQVKISGYRIEPAEIEAVFRLHPSISQAVVVIEENDFGEKIPAAFVKTAAGDEADIDDLKAFLRKKLPAYMIPAKIAAVGDFPLNANGKIDKKALARIAKMNVSEKFQAPRTELEIAVAEIWKNLLAKDEIGLEDDFFELGGHSLLATRLAAALKRDLAVEIPIIKIFENPTVHLQAAMIAVQKKNSGAAVGNKPIKAIRRGSKNIESLLSEVGETARTLKQ